jgi:GDP-L-fucose synthase
MAKFGTVCVTGGAGFLGSFVTAELRRRGYDRIFVPRRSEYDLTVEADVVRLFRDVRPEAVIHLAAVVGGIGANRASPGTFFYRNLMMGALMMEHARLAGVRKFAAVGTICAYPKHCRVPFREEDLWNGYPEETNAPYGLAKKMLLVQAQAYRQEFGFNAIYLLPVNLYGPGDNFDPATSHVIPALILKCRRAIAERAESTAVWGTGNATREFLYVADAAEAIVSALERYDGAEPVNIGTGREISIRDTAAMIAGLCGFTGRLEFDPAMPDGQPRRCVDVRRARELFGFTARTSLEDGLRQTIAWFDGRHRT